ncbi:hypothetical protein EDB86DRAFT_3091150 [Lactarius hatsudake]|nr:hypothetical protein EDB86DRAFT_3091150 [Lactarius hatsudake]
MPATYAYVAGTFSFLGVRPPLLPPPRPLHLHRKGDTRGQADALPLPVHRAQKRVHEGESPAYPLPFSALTATPRARREEAHKESGAHEGMLPPLPFPSLTSAPPRLCGMSAKARAPLSPFSLALPSPSIRATPFARKRGARRHAGAASPRPPRPLGAHNGTPPPSPCHPWDSLSLSAPEGDNGMPPPFLSLSPPAPPFHPVCTAPFARKGAHKGTPLRVPSALTLPPCPRHPVRAEGGHTKAPPPPLSLPPPAPSFPLIRATPFARKGAHEGTPLPIPRPPSALTLPPCPCHPVRAEWGHARASRYGAARTGQEGKAQSPSRAACSRGKGHTRANRPCLTTLRTGGPAVSLRTH